MSNSKGRILIVRGGSMSEFILTCPVFAALREQFPETKVEVLGYPRIAELGKAARLVDEVRSIESRAVAGFFARNAPLDDDLSDYFARFSVIFSYLYDPDGFFQMNVAKVSGAQFIGGPARPDEKLNLHASDAFLKPLERLAIFGAAAVPHLKFSPEQPSSKGALMAVHPSSENGTRQWPEAKWRNLLQALVEKTACRILLVGEESEAGLAQRLANGWPVQRIKTLNNGALSELGRQLAQCHAFVGHGSGISHLAAATGIPCVTIWSTASEAIWKPRGDNVTLLKSPAGANGVTEEAVLSTLPMIWSGAE